MYYFDFCHHNNYNAYTSYFAYFCCITNPIATGVTPS